MRIEETCGCGASLKIVYTDDAFRPYASADIRREVAWQRVQEFLRTHADCQPRERIDPPAEVRPPAVTGDDA